MKTEHDFLGEMNVPDNVYYGVQTIRAMENFHITGEHLNPDFIPAMAIVKKEAALANMETGRLDKEIGNALVQAASEIIDGQWLDQFPVDPIQGGAGTSVNMNMNEVLCNRALEIMGKEKSRYDLISPNNHAKMAQSTNDVFPTSIKVCLSMKGKKLTAALKELETELDVKADEFKDVIKMGRTHLQDAVPITLGQEMGAYASAVARGRKRISRSLEVVHVINMGGTAVGTGLNAEPAYIKAVAAKLSMLTGDIYVTARNLIDMTNNTDIFAEVSGNMKATVLMLIKMANDFRLMASGPRCGLNELKLPARQPGSSIMPGKVNPVMAFNLFHSMRYLTNAVHAFVKYLLKGVKANKEACQSWVDHSVGIVTALLPHIGYERSSMLAKEAYATGRPIREIILEHGYLTKEQIDIILSPQEMIQPGIAGKEVLEEPYLAQQKISG